MDKTSRVKEFTSNYNGEPIKPGEVMVPFPYTKLDAENCVNRECIGSIQRGGRRFPVIYKAVPKEWRKKAGSALGLVVNEELGHYRVPNSVSLDAQSDEFNMELGTSPSAEDDALGDDEPDLNSALSVFADLMKSLISKSPKIGYAVLLLYSKIRGEDFYKCMHLSHEPANRIRQKAKTILDAGLKEFDISSLKCYKSPHDDTYRREALELLNHIIVKAKELQ